MAEGMEGQRQAIRAATGALFVKGGAYDSKAGSHLSFLMAPLAAQCNALRQLAKEERQRGTELTADERFAAVLDYVDTLPLEQRRELAEHLSAGVQGVV